MNEISFVRGIAWHDIAKPFYLGGAKHSRTGFLLLAAAGFRPEATLALCHVSGHDLRENLGQFYDLTDDPLPAVLLLSNALDRLAASSYSLMEEPPKNPPFESWHNPFTRLPEIQPQLDVRFQSKQRHQVIDAALRKKLIEQAPASWRGALEKLLKQGGQLDEPLTWPEKLPPAAGEDGQRVNPIDLFYQYSRFYPERTYPPVNDTLLSEHTRLSAVFAWVVYRNLAEAGADILTQTISPAAEGGQLPDGTDAADFVSPKSKKIGYSPAQALVRDHLGAHLVRISFSGHRQWVEEAARLDDLNGAQVLTARMRDAFKQALADELGAGELAEFLWISESAFDLVYLLPDALGDAAALERLIQTVYEGAIDRLVDGQDGLQDLLHDDFRRAEPALDITGPERIAELKQQLLGLVYTLHVEPVWPPADKGKYGAFTAAYGEILLAAYKASLQEPLLPQAALAASAQALHLPEKEPLYDVCTVCGTHPVYADLADRLPDDEHLQKVTHTFRGEPERTCLTCIARRVLAHKQVQVEALHKMLHYDAETGAVRVEPPAEPELDLPPALSAGAKVEGPQDFVDMGAAFVRLARRRDAEHPLDAFPTVSYAADRMGNVAMLTLSATGAVFDEYPYQKAREAIEKLSDTARSAPAWDAFIQDYDAFCHRVAGTKEHSHLLDQVVTVEPHLARVLARQTRISRFFDKVATRLEEAGVRALPLDTTYPAGRWLIPAMSLATGLSALGRSVALDLLAVPETAGDEDDQRLAKLLDGPTRHFLGLTAPPLLDGTVVIFKQKFPIYLTLEAEAVLRADLAQEPAGYGLRLALADLRGTLTDWTYSQGDVSLDGLPDLLELNRAVDRRTVLLRAGAIQHITPELADALTVRRADHVRLDQKLADQLQRKEVFAPVLFLKKASRG